MSTFTLRGVGSGDLSFFTRRGRKGRSFVFYYEERGDLSFLG